MTKKSQRISLFSFYIKYFKYLNFSLLVFITSCSKGFEINKKPISFSDERRELTLQYIKEHYGIEKNNIKIIPKVIVLHWTAIDDFDSSFNVFNQEKLLGSRPDLAGAGEVNVSIHFLVDKEGNVFQLMPETEMARHVIGLNYVSVGVENVGGGSNIDNLTEEQIEANINLVKYLVKNFPSIEYLIGHHEYREFEDHQLWMEKDESYRTEKYDPGDRFMNAVREGVKDLNLKGAGEIRKEAL